MGKKVYAADELNNASKDGLIGTILPLQENIAQMLDDQELILEQAAILRQRRFGRHSEKMAQTATLLSYMAICISSCTDTTCCRPMKPLPEPQRTGGLQAQKAICGFTVPGNPIRRPLSCMSTRKTGKQAIRRSSWKGSRGYASRTATFIGEECVWIKSNAVWAMNYYGQSFNENFNSAFLKEALSHVSVSMPFRGPEFYQKGDYMYQCQIQGYFDCFSGEERIYCKQEKTYICTFHGGIIL